MLAKALSTHSTMPPDAALHEAGGNTDDEYLTWNRNSCDTNNDGPAIDQVNSLPYRCCM